MQRMYAVWIDVAGNTRLTLINTSAGASTVLAALQAKSNSDILNVEDTTLTVNASPAPVAATFQTVGDSAALTFTDAGGDLVTIQLPAPVSAVFMADGMTVDPAAIAAIIASVVGTVETGSGGLVTSYVGGIRRRTVREVY